MNPAELFSHEPNPTRLACGEVLFKAGDPGDAKFVVLEGELAIVADGRVVEKSRRGAIIGEMALIDETPRSATVTAHAPAVLVKVNAAAFSA